jgi:hypothetical protein
MRRTALIFVLLLVCYAYVLPRWADWNQNSRLNLVLAIVDDGTTSIDRYVANTGDYALYNGRAYSDKPPGLALLAMPAYRLLSPILDLPPVRERLAAVSGGDAFGDTLRAEGSGLREEKLRFALTQYLLTLLAVATPTAALGALLYLALLRLGIDGTPATLGALAYGLGSSAAPYAANFYSHQLVAALLFGAFFVAWPRIDSTPPKRAFASGLLCGLLLGWAVISEYPAVLAAAPIAIYALARRGWRWLATLALGGALPLLLLVVYDLAAFGTPLPIGYAHSALWQSQHQTGFMSITYPQPAALWGLTFGGFRGLFVRAPWLLLALPGYLLWWRSERLRAEWWVVLIGPLALLLFYSSSAMWWGGFAAGPRYIVPLIPFLVLPAAWALHTIWARPLLQLGAVALVVASVALVWVEATAGQSFPFDTVRATWSGYVLPAWAAGDIARNLGMALGLRGPASLAPLVTLVAMGALLICGAPPRVVSASRPTPLHREG